MRNGNQRMQSDPMLSRYNSSQAPQGQYPVGGSQVQVYPAVPDGRSRDNFSQVASSNQSEIYRDSPHVGSDESSMNGMSRNVSNPQFSYAPQDTYQQQQYQDENAYAGQRMVPPPRTASQGLTPTASAPQLANLGYNNVAQQGNGGYHQSNPNLVQQQMPRPPPKDGRLPPVPSKTPTAPMSLNDPNQMSQKQEQRTSWLKKRFSRAK
jgi:hypothetical protein